MEAYDGFADLQKELSALAQKINNPDIIKSVLEEGGKIIADKASGIVAATAKRKSGNLEKSIIVYGFDAKTNEISIGWKEDAFYGKILEEGFVPWTGKTEKMGKRKSRPRDKNKRTKLLSGKTKVYLKHLEPAYEQAKGTATEAMVNKLKKEIE